jgi:glycerophosphoryl diester phosphodiesterase
MLMLTSLSQPVIFAHRGASAHAPENTLAAFELALEQGADAIELDAKLTADGQVVVIHDATVDRTTDARGKVKELSLASLRSFSAGAFFASRFSAEKIPLLEEVFEAVGRRTFINVELTNYNSPRDHLVESACMLVKRFNLQKRVMFSSFFASNLSKARSYLPEVPCGLLALNGLAGAWQRSFGYAFGNYAALHPNLVDVTPQQIQRVHRLKGRVHVWTVNAEAEMRRLFGWGVDGIFTDDPALALRVRGEKR